MKIMALFFPALISISIYTRRQSIELKLNLRLLIKLGIYMLFINWCNMSLITYVLGIDLVTLESMESWSFFTKYVFGAMFLATVIPYIEEIIKKYIQVSFQVKSKVEVH